ncbi:MAG: hypothetical protein M3O91_08980 [Chloroflexota bacterium]|nr:hypothetical protein [Chloroflexota bacterium]
MAALAFDAPRREIHGLIPTRAPSEDKPARITQKTIRAMAKYVAERRTLDTPFDIIWERQTPGDDPAKASTIVRRWGRCRGDVVARVALEPDG